MWSTQRNSPDARKLFLPITSLQGNFYTTRASLKQPIRGRCCQSLKVQGNETTRIAGVESQNTPDILAKPKLYERVGFRNRDRT